MLEQAYADEVTGRTPEAAKHYQLGSSVIEEALQLEVPSVGLGPAFSNTARWQAELAAWLPLVALRCPPAPPPPPRPPPPPPPLQGGGGRQEHTVLGFRLLPDLCLDDLRGSSAFLIWRNCDVRNSSDSSDSPELRNVVSIDELDQWCYGGRSSLIYALTGRKSDTSCGSSCSVVDC